jgi:hypothetical protein
MDPVMLALDMGPYAGTPPDPHAFASGHQYGARVGLRGLGQQFVYQPRNRFRGLGATLPPALNTNKDPIPQLSQSFAYDPSGPPGSVATIDQTVSMPGSVTPAPTVQHTALKYGFLGLLAGVTGVFVGRWIRRKV